MLTRAELIEIRDILERTRRSTQIALDHLSDVALPRTRNAWQQEIADFTRLESRIQEKLDKEET